MSTLPEEAIIEILSYLPVKSLSRFRCVSRSWLSLVSDPHFIHFHLSRSIQTHKHNIFFKHGPNFFSLPSPPPNPTYPPDQIHFPSHNPRSMTNIVGSCNGIICLTTLTNSIFLLNPSTRSMIQLPDSPAQYAGYGVTRFPVFGLGYTSGTRQYKVLRIVYFHPAGSTVDSYHTEVKIHTLGANSWRVITDSLPHDIRDRSAGVLVDGSLHWITTRNNNGDGALTSNVIVSFDVDNEVFGNIPLPDCGNCNMNLLCDFNGSLCMFRNFNNEGRVEVWVMNEYGVRESWAQLFSISQQAIFGSPKYFQVLRFLKGDKILIRTSKGKLVVYDSRSESSREVTVRGVTEFFIVTNYVESLVPVNG